MELDYTSESKNTIQEIIEASLVENSESIAEEKVDLEFLYTREVDFRQETIYFLIVDRFYDGDPDNNLGPNPELDDPDRQDYNRYWGGDLQGVIEKLDYLKSLGVTAIWLNPLFEQIEDFAFDKAPVHGYWTRDFKRINPRLIGKDENPSLNETQETRDTAFDRLIEELHKRKMKLILDVVCNHSNPGINGIKGELFDDGVKIAEQSDDQNNWYHHYGDVVDWENEWQVQNCELGGLATFNENNNEYRTYIKSAIKQWIDRGVDALRIDTVKHMPLWFWQEFNADIQNHKPDIFTFGEWIYSRPDDPTSVNYANNSGMSLLDFGFAMAIREALGCYCEEGFHRVQNILDQDHVYKSATELITFIDNHDMHRFQTLNPDPDALKMAVALVMTSRGIPCIYYGTEQYLHDDTNGDSDPYGNNDPYNRPMMEKWDTDTPVYQTLRLLSGVRRLNPAVSLGSQWTKYLTPDVYCYIRNYRDSRLFVAINRGEAVTLETIDTDLPDGEHKDILSQQKYQVKNRLIENFELGSKQVIVFSHVGQRVKDQTILRVQVNGIATQPGETLVVVGDCPELGNWDIDKAYGLEYINSNTWFGEIAFNESAGKLITYKYAILHQGRPPVRENLIARRWFVASEGVMKVRDTWSTGGDF